MGWEWQVADWYFSCFRKRAMSENRAKQITKSAENSRPRVFLYRYRYRCLHCGRWHLTRKPPRWYTDYDGGCDEGMASELAEEDD